MYFVVYIGYFLGMAGKMLNIIQASSKDKNGELSFLFFFIALFVIIVPACQT